MAKLDEILAIIAKEPSEKTFYYKGYKCRIWRHPEFLTLNGYVALPYGHRYYKKGYDDIDIQCHGGLTFCGFWTMKDPGSEPDSLWYIGFDTAHAMDYNPGITQRLPASMQFSHEHGVFADETYKDIEYVTREIKRIVDQL